MDRITRRKPRKYKGLHPQPPKTSRRELSVVERAFVAGACIAGSLSHNDCAKLMHPRCNKSTITRVCQRVNQMAEQLSCSVSDPRCFENPTNRGAERKLTDAQEAMVVDLVTSNRQHREQEAWQLIQSGELEAIGLPKISISLLETIMYRAGYSRRRPGWKPSLTTAEEEDRYQWAVLHNPDRYHEGDNLGFDFHTVCFTDETPARVGEQRGMIRAWAKDGEEFHEDVKKTRKAQHLSLMFYGSFMYDHKGPCHVYPRETAEEKAVAAVALAKENAHRAAHLDLNQTRARSALRIFNEADANGHYNTRRRQYIPSKMDYHRGIRIAGGVDGYRHREGALKKVVPWLQGLKASGVKVQLLEDGVPPHKARISNDYLDVHFIEKLSWPGHSPDVNASEHAWPWQRKYVTRHNKPSRNAAEVQQQWEEAWDALPIEVINGWVDRIPEVVRRIIRHHGKNDFHG
jgi:hypothetical protein